MLIAEHSKIGGNRSFGGSNLPEVTGSGCFSITGAAAGFVHFPRFGAALALQMLLPELPGAAANEVHGGPRKKSSPDELSRIEHADNDVNREHKETDAIAHNSTAILGAMTTATDNERTEEESARSPKPVQWAPFLREH